MKTKTAQLDSQVEPYIVFTTDPLIASWQVCHVCFVSTIIPMPPIGQELLVSQDKSVTSVKWMGQLPL